MAFILFIILFCFLFLMVIFQLLNDIQSLKDRIYVLEVLVEILRGGEDIDK